MTERSVVHSTFNIERIIPASPARVYAAWATKEGKSRWFAGPAGWTEIESEFDFRVGGREVMAGRWPDGKTSRYVATYHDIVPEQRIITTYDMYVNDKQLSVSVATVELQAHPEGTRVVLTEQGTYIDGSDDGRQREEGTRWLLEKVAKSLE
jgi:uncharacterized protein YndB with AHSA1/START domain